MEERRKENNRSVDVVIFSASRPEYLKEVLPTLFENISFSGNLNFYLHEDVVIPGKSGEVIHLLKYNYPQIKLIKTSPAQRLGFAIHKMLRMIPSPYMLFMEDDFLLIRKINLDEIVNVFEKEPKVNQIIFNKEKTKKEKDGFQYWEENLTIPLVLASCWSLNPAIWRTSFIKPKWIPFEYERRIQTVLNQACALRSEDWVKHYVGNYFYGKHLEPPFVKHIGRKSIRQTKVQHAL